MVDIQWSFISLFTASFVNFVLRIIIGRELGPAGLGVYTLVFVIYLLGMQFAAFGVTSALTKYVAEFIDDHNTVRKYVSSGMTSSIISGTLMAVVLYLFAPYLAISFFKIPEMEGFLELIALCLPFIAIQKAVLGTLNGFRKMHLYALVNIAQYVSVVCLSIVLVIVFNMGVFGAVIGLVVPTIIVGILSPLLIKTHLGCDNSFWDMSALRATTIFGFFVVLSNSIGYLATQIDSILIGHYLDPTAVGIYAVAILLVQALTLVPNAIQCVTYPAMATLFGKGDVVGVRHIFYSTLKKSFLLTSGVAVLLAICAPLIITLLFGQQFLGAYVPLLILLIGYTVDSSFSAVGTTLGSIGKVHIVFRIQAICVVLNIILNILLIPPLGISGAALATSIMLIVDFIITTALINRYLSLEEKAP
jgi:O-antigen/teichoic acid export membrane protein